jgi:hypothetical protein
LEHYSKVIAIRRLEAEVVDKVVEAEDEGADEEVEQGLQAQRYQLLYLLLQLPPPLAHVTPATPVVHLDITHVIVLTH